MDGINEFTCACALGFRGEACEESEYYLRNNFSLKADIQKPLAKD